MRARTWTPNRHARRTLVRRLRRGSALIPALMVVSLLAMLGLSMLSAGLNGARTVNHHGDEFRLTSAVESVGILAAETLWSGFSQNTDQNGDGISGNIADFKAYLDSVGLSPIDLAGAPWTPPGSADGHDLMALVDVPGAAVGNPEFDNVNIDALRLVRRDIDAEDTVQLYITVSASTNRGSGIVNPVLNRAIQLVYTIEPDAFEGFEYGILANNVNCVFCHAQVDSTERYWNTDSAHFGEFERVKVGTLESLMIRHEWDSRPDLVSDWDADSLIAGSLYVRGPIIDQHGAPIGSWSDASLRSFAFDSEGLLIQDDWGDLSPTDFVPAGSPPGPFENLYTDYPTDYAAMPDGKLPTEFPPPFPDDGGINAGTGMPGSGAGNKQVDPDEFYAVAKDAEGAVIAGIINFTDPSFQIDTTAEYSSALFSGNVNALRSGLEGNVILSGTQADPIVIDGDVAIDGDLVINGYVKGEGSLLVSGNIYVPTDLKYLDGREYTSTDIPGNPTGERTFGIAQDGTKNALALAAGGNILLGDYLKPSRLGGTISDGLYNIPIGEYDFISGDTSDGADGSVGSWSFALAEMSLFNRKEWMKTQPLLPGPGDDKANPASWTVSNPYYEAGYMPRYYQFGDGDTIPIYNGGDIYFDPVYHSWVGDEEVPLTWDPDLMTLIDPSDTSDPHLYDAFGNPIATISQITTENGWLSEWMQKLAIEYFEDHHTYGTPMEIDGLLYTNNAIFGIVARNDRMRGQMRVNGAIVCADLGLLTPGYLNTAGQGTSSNVTGSPYAVGLQLNYDRRLKNMLRVTNPNQVTIKRTLWNPTSNILP